MAMQRDPNVPTSLRATPPAGDPTALTPWTRTGDVLLCETRERFLLVTPAGLDGRHRYFVFAHSGAGPGDVIATGIASDAAMACHRSLSC